MSRIVWNFTATAPVLGMPGRVTMYDVLITAALASVAGTSYTDPDTPSPSSFTDRMLAFVAPHDSITPTAALRRARFAFTPE